MSREKESPIIEKMGPTVYTIFEKVGKTLYEVAEHRDPKKARRQLNQLNKNNTRHYVMREEDRPDLAPKTSIKKFQPTGWRY